MAHETGWSFLKQQIQSGYTLLFGREWPAWISGIFLAVLALLIFMWWHPWGVAGGYNNWGSWFFYLIGVYEEPPANSPLLNGMSLSNLGIIAGALASALLGKQFKINKAPPLEYVKGIAGGILMGLGAALASGCNVGGFYTAMGMFDLGGLTMMFGLLAGAYLGLRYLLWEMEHVSIGTSLKAKKNGNAPRRNYSAQKPYFGLGLFLLVLVVFQIYSWLGLTQMGGLLFFGFLIGLVMHRSRFCFANAFREPFMTGDGRMMRAVLISLMVYALGSAVIKWSYIQPPGAGVFHPATLGSPLGGLIFGLGMILAGGCASGTLWRAGEGHLKLWVALVVLALSNSASSRLLSLSGIRDWLGQPVLLPEIIAWQPTLVLYYLFFGFFILLLLWNERNEKFVVF
ncbi:MAG: YeeE/YedE family protein [Desulfohalobiaceae bacterium]|nr:YeeE/YedE family protein [Desulfohalobiaceae bacterium]